MKTGLVRDEALVLLRKYNHEEFHLVHALTVEAVMRWFSKKLNYADEIEFWGMAGLLHDLDYERYPDEHCKKSAELLNQAGASQDLIHAVCSHGYRICCDVEPIHQMEKVLYTVDELTGLIGAATRLRPSKSCSDMKVSSIKKKFKDKSFASGCSRDVIRHGAQMLDWELDELFDRTLQAMKSCEDSISKELQLMLLIQ